MMVLYEIDEIVDINMRRSILIVYETCSQFDFGCKKRFINRVAFEKNWDFCFREFGNETS